MSVKPEVKAVIKLEIASRKPKTYTEALKIVGEVLKKYATPHTDLFDPRRNCAKWLKKNMFAA